MVVLVRTYYVHRTTRTTATTNNNTSATSTTSTTSITTQTWIYLAGTFHGAGDDDVVLQVLVHSWHVALELEDLLLGVQQEGCGKVHTPVTAHTGTQQHWQQYEEQYMERHYH